MLLLMDNVMPAQAGILQVAEKTPAFAGVTFLYSVILVKLSQHRSHL